MISGGFLLTFAVEDGTRPSGSGVIPTLVVVFVLAVLWWIATTEGGRQHRPTFHVQPRGGGWALYIERPKKSPRSKKVLKQRAEQASAGILQLLTDYERNDPGREPWWYLRPDWDELPEEEKTRIFHEHNQRSSDHLRQLIARYEVEYSIEALALFDEFEKRGMADGEKRHRFEWPVNTFGVREVGQSLGVWARQL